MNKLFFSILVISFSLYVSAQPFEDKIEYNKEKQNALAMVYNYTPQAVENALIDKLGKLGYKGKIEKGIFNRDKGFHVFKGALFGDISANKYDYLVNIDQKSSKTKDETILHLIIMKDDVNALAKLSPEELSNAKTFLNNLLPDIEDADLEIKIAAQELVVIQADRKLLNLQGEREEIQRKIKKLQDDLKLNEKQQEKQKEALENHRSIFDGLKSKRRTGL